VKFWKYHGLGNDFIILDNRDQHIHITGAGVKEICHRRFGVGADGVILVEKSRRADIRMIIYNSDGSRPAMCGNGIRCFACFVYDKGLVKQGRIDVETDAGVLHIEVREQAGKFEAAVVNMGKPDFTSKNVPVNIIDKQEVINHEIQVMGHLYKITSLLMGVPHTVLFVEDISDDIVIAAGKAIENASLFPEKTNVNFVKVIDREHMIIRTWERGAGYTYACGTGACACVAAGVANGLIEDKVCVELRGGRYGYFLEE
jgi:diaminopimelate epimerase